MKKCHNCKEEIVKLFYDIIIDSNHSILLKNFIKKLKKPILLGILDGAYLRESAFKFYDHIKSYKGKNDDICEGLIRENSHTFDPEPYRKLQVIHESSLSNACC